MYNVSNKSNFTAVSPAIYILHLYKRCVQLNQKKFNAILLSFVIPLW